MPSKVDILEDIARVLMAVIAATVLAGMAWTAVNSVDVTFPFKAGSMLLLVIVLMMNKEQRVKELIRAWRGDDDSGSSGGGGNDGKR